METRSILRAVKIKSPGETGRRHKLISSDKLEDEWKCLHKALSSQILDLHSEGGRVRQETTIPPIPMRFGRDAGGSG